MKMQILLLKVQMSSKKELDKSENKLSFELFRLALGFNITI